MDKEFNKIINGAKEVLDQTCDNIVKLVDQNNDGILDLEDLSIVADTFKDAIIKGTSSIIETAEDITKQYDLKVLQPIFIEDMNGIDMPKFIRVVDRDKRYIDKEVCKGSIGYWRDLKDLRLMNLFRDSLDVYGISFYPANDSEFYYVNPIEKDNYIALDEYFSYLKQMRIGELQRIAQDLGATYFKVVYKEEQIAFSENKIEGNLKIEQIGNIDGNYEAEAQKYSKVEIAGEMHCVGHNPIKPLVKYLRYEPAILNLIELRMNAQGPLKHQKLILQLSHTSGMKEHDALKIDAIINGLNCSGNATVSSEIRNEGRRYLEYEIDF